MPARAGPDRGCAAKPGQWRRGPSFSQAKGAAFVPAAPHIRSYPQLAGEARHYRSGTVWVHAFGCMDGAVALYTLSSAFPMMRQQSSKQPLS